MCTLGDFRLYSTLGVFVFCVARCKSPKSCWVVPSSTSGSPGQNAGICAGIPCVCLRRRNFWARGSRESRFQSTEICRHFEITANALEALCLKPQSVKVRESPIPAQISRGSGAQRPGYHRPTRVLHATVPTRAVRFRHAQALRPNLSRARGVQPK